MAYGVTNAGKTFTMQGTPGRPGLVPQALASIFKVGWWAVRVCDQASDDTLTAWSGVCCLAGARRSG
jgi:hypothetical protein